MKLITGKSIEITEFKSISALMFDLAPAPVNKSNAAVINQTNLAWFQFSLQSGIEARLSLMIAAWITQKILYLNVELRLS